MYLWCAAAISTAVLGAGLVDLTDNIPLGEPSDLSRQLAVPHLAEALDLLGQLVSRFIEKAFQSAGEAFSCAVKAKQRISFFSPANAVLAKELRSVTYKRSGLQPKMLNRIFPMTLAPRWQ